MSTLTDSPSSGFRIPTQGRTDGGRTDGGRTGVRDQTYTLSEWTDTVGTVREDG